MENRNHLELVLAKEPKTAFKKWLIFGVLVLLTVLSFQYIKFNEINDAGVKIAQNILKNFIDANWSMLFDFTSKSGVPFLLFETIAIAIVGTVLGAIISLPLAFISSRNITKKWSVVGVVLITLIRCIPSLVYVLVFVKVALGAVAGILTFAVTSIGMISKLYIEAIEQLDPGVLEALDSSGCNMYQKIMYGIIPQLKSNFLSTILYRFEINIKNATVLGMVGAGGIGAELMLAMSNYRWNDAATIIIGIIILVLVIENFSAKLRHKLIHG